MRKSIILLALLSIPTFAQERPQRTWATFGAAFTKSTAEDSGPAITGVGVRRVRALIAAGSLKAHQLGREYAIEESALAQVTVYRKAGRPPKAEKKGARKK